MTIKHTFPKDRWVRGTDELDITHRPRTQRMREEEAKDKLVKLLEPREPDAFLPANPTVVNPPPVRSPLLYTPAPAPREVRHTYIFELGRRLWWLLVLLALVAVWWAEGWRHR